MNTAEEFERLAKKWAKHCESVMVSPFLRDRLNHPAYPKLVKLGWPAIPFIFEQYQEKEGPPWEFVLDEITGLKIVENPYSYSPYKVRKRWIEWWEQQQTTE